MFNIDPDNHFHASISTDTKYYSDEQFVRDVKSKGDLSFIHFNARSLNKNFHKIKDSIDDLKLSFDIIAISETWAETDTIDGFTLNGYEAFHIVRGQRKGGGVALYVHRRFNCAIRAVQCKVVEQVFECVTVELDLKKHKNITVSCVYRTPGSDVDLFCESLEQIFSDVMPRKSMFICGDFNIDLMKYETHNGTKRFLDCMYGLGLYPLIDRPSRITNHSCTLIDNIFTNQINYSIRSGLLMNDITDHLPIFALCNYEIENKKSDPVKYVRNLKNENVSLLIESLSQEMWNNVLQSDDVNVAYINFIETFSKLYNLHCPVKKAHAKGIYKKPWITNGLKNACRKKNGLYRSFLRERTHTSEYRYKTYKNKLTSILRLAEKAYYSKMLLEKRGNIKETWAILNTVLGKQRKSVNYPTHLMQRDIHITSKENMANEFNTFFTNVGPNLANDITEPDENISIYDYLGESIEQSLFMRPVDEEEVITTVTGCTKKRSADFEDISMDTVAKVVSVICKPLAHICNISFKTGVFPSRMKIAKVIPMFKSGTKTDVTNYRPISLLPQFSKILEKLFLTRINSFLCVNNILSSSQYGFRTNLSTSLAVMELIEEITNATDNKKHAIGVFIDLKKAFDTVDHRILIKKLEHYGVRGAASDWLKSYLSNRKQFVNIDGCSSELLDVICGVPQGSILGPTLFILYINDICNVSNLVKFILFADDTNVFCAGDNQLELECMLNRELAKLCKWFAVNKLSLNLSKTSYMLFRNRPPDVDFNVFIEHERINRVRVTKFLGIYIDDKLNWKYHINTVRSKLSKVAAIIYRASCLINQDGIYMLYCSLFLPYINYCSEIWGNTYATNVECITVLQKRLVRLICGARRLDHTNPLFKQLGILKFVDLVKFKTSIIKRITMYYRIACKKCLIYVYKYTILAKNVLSVFIVPIPT